MTAGTPSTLGASIAPRRFVDAYRTAKIVFANRVRHVDIPSEPYFDEESTAYFRAQLERARNYLEYGSGGSTILANRLVNMLVSVDTDGNLLADVRRKLAEQSRRALTRLIHVNIGLTLDSGMPLFTKPTRRRVRRWEDYPTAPWRYLRSIAQQPDLILVDGRFRVACVLESLLSLSPLSNTRILVNDYVDRPHYHVVERFADFERVGRMAVLRPRRLIDRIQVRRLVRQYSADPR
jgi:hypothetical protein